MYSREEKMRVDLRKVFMDIAQSAKNGFHGQFIISIQGHDITSFIQKESKDLKKYSPEEEVYAKRHK